MQTDKHVNLLYDNFELAKKKFIKNEEGSDQLYREYIKQMKW